MDRVRACSATVARLLYPVLTVPLSLRCRLPGGRMTPNLIADVMRRARSIYAGSLDVDFAHAECRQHTVSITSDNAASRALRSAAGRSYRALRLA